MAYKFADRLQEWTTYAGVVAGGLASVLPQLIPADNHWVQLWQAVQMAVAAALVFIPQTAGTTAIENDAWSLLKAFINAAPAEYKGAMQPLVTTLAAHLAKAETGTGTAPATPAPVVIATPVAPIAPPPVTDPAAAVLPVVG